MSTTLQSRSERPGHTRGITRGVLQRGAQVIGILILYAVLFLVSSGRLDWVAAWLYLGVFAGTILVNTSIMLPRNPEFIAQRGQRKQDAKGWDKQVTAIAGVFMIVGLVVPGLDSRFSWSAPFPQAVQVGGFGLLVLGCALFSWAMLSNEFFETEVRIQKERGQSVATSGPYRHVRHPGYVGMILQLIATPIALGSWWGLIPAAFAAAMFILRTALEDKTLMNELAGYREYAESVRFRLLPGLW